MRDALKKFEQAIKKAVAYKRAVEAVRNVRALATRTGDRVRSMLSGVGRQLGLTGNPGGTGNSNRSSTDEAGIRR